MSNLYKIIITVLFLIPIGANAILPDDETDFVDQVTVITESFMNHIQDAIGTSTSWFFNLLGNDTDDITEGSTNLFYTDAYVSTYLTGGTGITESAGTISFDCSEVEGTGIDCTGEAITLDATGAWTGTFDGLEGTAYLARANHTGTQSTTTITGTWDISQNTNLAVSGTLLNLTGDTLSVNEGTLTNNKACTYVSGTGIVCDTTLTSGTVTSVDMSVPTGLAISGNPITTSGTLALALDTGYIIPLSASTTNWNTFYDTPSNRITAGDYIDWSGNTLNLASTLGSEISPLTAGHFTTLTASSTVFETIYLNGLFQPRLQISTSTELELSYEYDSNTGLDWLSNDVQALTAGGTNTILIGNASTTLIGTVDLRKLANLTSNGFIKTSGGDGTLSVDTATYESGLTAGDFLTRTGNDFDADTGAIASGATTVLASAGAIYDFVNTATSTAYAGANPTGTIGLTAVNGSATTFLRSDGAPALSQAIIPTWTGTHTFSNGTYSALFTGGSVGIGSTTPFATLGVENIGSGLSFAVNDVAGDSTPFVIDASGNVGIGTTAPATPLHIRKISLTDNSANSLLTIDGKFNDASIDNADIVGITFRVENSTGGADSDMAIAYSYDSNLLLNKDGGNVGIGTTVPGAKLDVRTDDANTNSVVNLLDLWHTTSGTAADGIGTGISLIAERANGASVTLANIKGILTDATNVDSALTFETRTAAGSLTEQMRITDTGNVGIASSSPSSTLSVGNGRNATTTSGYYKLFNNYCVYEDQSTSTPNISMGVCP